MAINFKKLKSQITPYEDEKGCKGWLFTPTKEQESKEIPRIFTTGSKEFLMIFLIELIEKEDAFRRDLNFKILAVAVDDYGSDTHNRTIN